MHYNYRGTYNNPCRLENIEIPRDIFKRVLITGIIKFVTVSFSEKIDIIAKIL